MLWGCFSAKGTDNISVINGRMNVAAYQNILEANLMILAENLELSTDRIIIALEDPKHTANLQRNALLKIM